MEQNPVNAPSDLDAIPRVLAGCAAVLERYADTLTSYREAGGYRTHARTLKQEAIALQQVRHYWEREKRGF